MVNIKRAVHIANSIVVPIKPWNKLSLIVVVGLIVLPSFLIKKPPSLDEKIVKYYLTQTDSIKTSLKQLQSRTLGGASSKQLQALFIMSRRKYKRLAVLSEFFHVYHTKYINGPALPRVEEDNPNVVIPPHGYQLLEELIFSPFLKNNRRSIAQEIDQMLNVLDRIVATPDLQYAFTEDNVLKAIRSSLIRLTTLGLSGYDSPIAGVSLTEATTTLESIEGLLLLVDDANANQKRFIKVYSLLNESRKYLISHSDHNRFDYLFFIKEYLNKVSKELHKAAYLSNSSVDNRNYPFNLTTASLFDSNYFNKDFFSPNERYSFTQERLNLGKKLFYNPILSGAGGRSCASCHMPQKAFTDGLKTAMDVDEGALERNTPTLWNSVYQTKQFFDSRTATLENQLSAVVHNEKEMKGSLINAVKKLNEDSDYKVLFQKAYPLEEHPITQFTIANAVSTYVRSLSSLNSRFDQHMREEKNILSLTEKKGFNLFVGKAKCASCHFIPLFNGLVPPDFNETESEILGILSSKKNKQLDKDLGKFNFTNASIHKYSFKTPTLRNIALTAPYMHNGVFETLEEVIDFYDKGGGKGIGIKTPNQTLPSTKLHLSTKEKKAIVAFLQSLTDTSGIK